MRFLILVKASAASEGGAMPDEALIIEMARYHEALAKAGVLLDAGGLHPWSKGWRVQIRGEARERIEGPFDAAETLITGYTLIQTRTREEAIDWAQRYPNPAGNGDAEIEVRQLFELEDFTPAAPVPPQPKPEPAPEPAPEPEPAPPRAAPKKAAPKRKRSPKKAADDAGGTT